LDGNIDIVKYINVLSHGLIKTVDEHGLDLRKVKFMQDNAPIHTARTTMEWLRINKIQALE
jgi:hypothetical protein